MSSRRVLPVLSIVVAGLVASLAFASEPPEVRGEVDAVDATVGARIGFRLDLRLPAGWSFDAEGLGPDLGAFRVLSGAWQRVDSPEEAGSPAWRWAGEIAAYETGERTVPAVRVRVRGPEGPVTLSTDPIDVRIGSVLPEDADPATLEIADLKDPASIAPDFTALRIALAALAALLVLAGVVWWVTRRFAGRLAAAPAPPDPFERLQPHEWAFRELQRLLERRLHEDGRVDEFHAELSRIVKRYLEGRYRVDLLERTTSEAEAALAEGDVPRDRIEETSALLSSCDEVKFAGVRPPAEACRARVEEAYRLVDSTRPVDRPAAAERAS